MPGKVEISIPDGVLRATVMAKIEEQLSAKGEDLLVNLVAHHLTQPRRGSYDKTPVWEEWFKEYLETVAKSVFKEIMEEQRAEIKAQLVKKITTAKYSNALAESLVEAVSKAWLGITVNLKDKR